MESPLLDAPHRPMKRRPVTAVLAGDQLVLFDGNFNGGLSCVAEREDGRRCGRDVLDGVYSGFWECHISGADGYVSVYETGGLVPADQVLQQRCGDHVNAMVPDAVPPTGVIFDPELHKDVIRPYSPYWTPQGVVEQQRSPNWSDLPVRPRGEVPARTVEPEPPAAQVVPLQPKPTALYRYWDEGDALLYVGITGDLKHRERSHLRRSSWMEFVARSTVERFPSREDAEAAEVAAILAERPLFNAKHNESPEAVRRVVEYLVEHGRTDLLAPAVSRG